LLIALGLEGAVEAAHHHSQVAEARESILHEIGANRAELQKHMERLSRQEKTITSMRSGLEPPHPAANPDDHLNVSLAGLRRAAYETAIATGTLALMDYTEASRYAQTYQEQTVLDALQNNAVFQIEMSLVAALPGPANSLTGVERLSSGQLASLKEKMDAYRAHLVLYRAAAKELDDEYGKYAGQ
jgi:hypothetical protein